MKWCKVIGTEPYLCLNFGTGTLDEAINWLEYCNGTRKTHYANLRRRNGHEEPYNVKYWALGNEVWGPWQVGQLSKEDYAKKAFQWGKALKLIDPNIELILCGETGHSSWDYYVLQQAISVTSMHSIHIYSIGKDHLANATAPLCAERSIEMTASFIDLARIENKIPQSVPRQTVCFDEWNVWDPERAVGSEGAEERYSISDMVAVGVWLNVFVRQSKYLGMANIAQTVNVISPLMTSKEGIRKQSTWWPLWLFSNYMHGHTLGVHLSCDAYDGPTQPEWIRGTIDTPWLDVSASLSDDRWVSLVVVNIRSDRSVEVDLKGLTSDGEVVVYTVMDESEDALEQRPAKDAKLTESKWDGKGKYSFGKHSVTMLRWKHTS